MNNGQEQIAAAKNDYANIIGPQVRKWRFTREWSQAELAVQLQLRGFDVSRGVVAAIEGQTHCVKDKHIIFFVRALRIGLLDLFPMSEFNGEIVVSHHLHKMFGPEKVVMKS